MSLFTVDDQLFYWTPRIGPNATLIYVVLRACADADGVVEKTQEALAEKSGLCVRMVWSMLRLLEKEGLIASERTGRACRIRFCGLRSAPHADLIGMDDLSESPFAEDARRSAQDADQIGTECRSSDDLIVCSAPHADQFGTGCRTAEQKVDYVPPSSPPSLLPPNPHTHIPPIIPPERSAKSARATPPERAAQSSSVPNSAKEYVPQREPPPAEPVARAFLAYAEKIGAHPPERVDIAFQLKMLLAAYRRQRYPDSPPFTKTDFKALQATLLEIRTLGILPEDLEAATGQAMRSYSRRDMVTLRAVMIHLSELLDGAKAFVPPKPVAKPRIKTTPAPTVAGGEPPPPGSLDVAKKALGRKER